MSSKPLEKTKDQQWIYLTGKEIYQFFHKVKGRFQGIQVYALVGKSGTGKSFRAKLLAEKIGVPYIVDDGLLIYESVILAGKSAKHEKNYISAIKTALFANPEHRQQVVDVLQRKKIKKILLLGTSNKMVVKIAEQLELPPISEIINIEEIASKQDIENAIKARKEEGKHVIPVPAIEVKRDYSLILRDSVRIFFKGGSNPDGKKKARFFEKSLVSPVFQDKSVEQSNFKDKKGVPGTVSISEAALLQMILHCVDEYDGDIQVRKIKVKSSRAGYGINMYIDVPYGKSLGVQLHDLREYILAKLQQYTGIILNTMEISVDKVSQRVKKEETTVKKKISSRAQSS